MPSLSWKFQSGGRRDALSKHCRKPAEQSGTAIVKQWIDFTVQRYKKQYSNMEIMPKNNIPIWKCFTYRRSGHKLWARQREPRFRWFRKSNDVLDVLIKVVHAAKDFSGLIPCFLNAGEKLIAGHFQGRPTQEDGQTSLNYWHNKNDCSSNATVEFKLKVSVLWVRYSRWSASILYCWKSWPLGGLNAPCQTCINFSCCKSIINFWHPQGFYEIIFHDYYNE